MDMDTSAALATAGKVRGTLGGDLHEAELYCQKAGSKKRKRNKDASNGAAASPEASTSKLPAVDDASENKKKEKKSKKAAERSTFAETHKPQKPSAKAKAGEVRFSTPNGYAAS